MWILTQAEEEMKILFSSTQWKVKKKSKNLMRSELIYTNSFPGKQKIFAHSYFRQNMLLKLL